MRKLVMILFALCGLSTSALGQGGKPRVVLMNPHHANGPAVVIPAGTALRVSFPSDPDHNAKFSGQMTLTGTYEIKGYGDDAWARLWPDSKSRAVLPFWRNWWEGPPKEITLEDGWTFAQAVVSKGDLQKLKTDQFSTRGRVTIIVDRYETSIDCDSASYSARFVSVVDRNVQMAAQRRQDEPGEGEC